MKRNFIDLVEDVRRLGPLLAVSFALIVNVANIMHVLDGELSLASGAERFAAALAIGVIGTRAITNLLLRYGRQVALSEAEQGEKGA